MKQEKLTLEACKLAAIQSIANAESLEDVYWTMMETRAQIDKEWREQETPLPQYTMEEINQWLDEAEADIDADRGYTCEDVHQMLEEEFPWLK